MHLYTDDLAALILMLATGGTLVWAALRTERMSLRIAALAFSAVFLFAFVPGTVTNVRAKHGLAQLVAVPKVERIRIVESGPESRTTYVYTTVLPAAVLAFYDSAEHTTGWTRVESEGALVLARGTERLEIRPERGSWDGTRGTLGLTKVVYRWEQLAFR